MAANKNVDTKAHSANLQSNFKQIIVAQNWSVVATQQCNASLVIKMLRVRILLGAGLFLAIYLSVVCPYKDPSRRRNIKNATTWGMFTELAKQNFAVKK